MDTLLPVAMTALPRIGRAFVAAASSRLFRDEAAACRSELIGSYSHERWISARRKRKTVRSIQAEYRFMAAKIPSHKI
jgi:hypothetical protein